MVLHQYHCRLTTATLLSSAWVNNPLIWMQSIVTLNASQGTNLWLRRKQQSFGTDCASIHYYSFIAWLHPQWGIQLSHFSNAIIAIHCISIKLNQTFTGMICLAALWGNSWWCTCRTHANESRLWCCYRGQAHQLLCDILHELTQL